MTPKEKANELFDKYDKIDFHDCSDHKQSAKECAIIAVDEILVIKGNYLIERTYWQQVKEELEKM